MKANELMVGDLVLVTPIGKIAKVFEISSIDNEIGVFFTPADGDAFDLTEIEPIPLTEELLKLNGFNCSRTIPGGHIIAYTMKIDATNDFALDEINKQFYVPFCEGVAEINYVHELQHYLRLIGLTELANNFKIK